MEKLRVFGLLVLPTAAVTGLLVLYFDWRARLLSRIRGDERNEHGEAA